MTEDAVSGSLCRCVPVLLLLSTGPALAVASMLPASNTPLTEEIVRNADFTELAAAIKRDLTLANGVDTWHIIEPLYLMAQPDKDGVVVDNAVAALSVLNPESVDAESRSRLRELFLSACERGSDRTMRMSALTFLSKDRVLRPVEGDRLRRMLNDGKSEALLLAWRWQIKDLAEEARRIVFQPISPQLGETVSVVPTLLNDGSVTPVNGWLPNASISAYDLARAYLAWLGDETQMETLKQEYSTAPDPTAFSRPDSKNRSYWWVLLYLAGQPPCPPPPRPLPIP